MMWFLFRCLPVALMVAAYLGLNLLVQFQGKRAELCERELIVYKVQAGVIK